MSAKVYVSVAEQRLLAMRRALYDTADAHGMPISVRQLTVLAEAVTATLYPDRGRADPALAIGQHTDRRRTGRELSPKELVVLRYAANGCSNAETGRLINRDEDTVKTHMRSIRRKLGARDRAHAVALYCTSPAYTAGDVVMPGGEQ